MTEEERRIRGYLQAQAAKLSPVELIGRVEAAMADLRTALFAVPADRLLQRPADEEWSAAEVMAHIIGAGAQFTDGIVRALEGDSAQLSGNRTEPTGPPRSAVEWWGVLQRDRAALFERVRRTDPAANLDRAIDHGMFGSLNWRETLLFLRVHDLDHARQLQAIAAALS